MSRILLISPSFFGYRQRVSEELIRQGHAVECMDDRPREDVTFKSLAKISYKLVEGSIDRYATSLARYVADKRFDQVIYMGGMSFCWTRSQFERIRHASDATFTAYLWDSIANCQRFKDSMDLFDRVLSFEPEDCEQYGMELRPLFYSDAYRGLPLTPDDGFQWDACFIGSVHQPSKFHTVLEIARALERHGLRVFTWFYMPSRSVEKLRKLTDATYRGVEFKFEGLPADKVAGVYAHSRCIIDSPQQGQLGLTMRTLETVGARRKLITANHDVAHYDFHANGDVLVWDGTQSVDDEFFARPFHPLPDDVYRSYSIAEFARTLLDDGHTYHGYDRKEHQK
ncbi:CgeB family protein [Bifidobacterium platyrrhinorum]|uniref:Eps11J n=1 Tax=Bifidobacterium platyrrhinorum TaxID=2661628 RepID=A0A6L9SRP4_9BIFI|nr:hypothetical protein [Bifidobacterium platyrrhinorum]NEG55138.1 hypothetical protein [Bifidobacterium platyrrhinorum]